VSDDLEKLRAKIELMRELGVTEADGIKLGAPIPDPKKKETAEEFNARQIAIAQKHHDIMFAASGTKPTLRLAKK